MLEKLTEKEKKELWEEFLLLGEEALSKSHYELANSTPITNPIKWKIFIMEQDVIEYVNQEQNILLQTEIRKLTKDASKSNSIGRAQLLTAIGKVIEEKPTKQGERYIYMYVPLTPDQEKAKNVIKEKEDIFKIKNIEEVIETKTMEINNNNNNMF